MTRTPHAARLGDGGESDVIGPDVIDKLCEPAKRLAAWRWLITDTVESVTVAPAMTADRRPVGSGTLAGSRSGSSAGIHKESRPQRLLALPSTPSGPTSISTIAESDVVVGHASSNRENQRLEIGVTSGATFVRQGRRDIASPRSPVSGRRLYGAHKSGNAGGHSHAADAAAATLWQRTSRRPSRWIASGR
jgi:hypothetical protein